MKRIVTLALAITFCVAAALRADEAKKVFDEIYGPKIKAAIASLDKADDHALVVELTRLASDNATDEALAIVILTQAYDLAMRDPSGARLAAEAMAALASRVEAQRDFATEKRIDALNLLLLRGKTEEREEAGGEMVDLLIEQGDAQASEGKYTEATAIYRRAILATGRIKSRSADDIKPRIETTLQQARAVKQAETFRSKLLSDRNDTATAEALVKLYLAELDDPKAAEPYLEIVKDEALKQAATLAVHPVGALNEADALALAEWYYAQSRGAKELPAAVTLGRAKACLERFLSLHGASDLARSKALAIQADIQKRFVAQPNIPQRVPAKVSSALLKGAVLAYSFERNTVGVNNGEQVLRDLSGSECHGKLAGGQLTTGIAGDAMAFDGKNNCILPDRLVQHLTNELKTFSLVVWIKTQDSSRYALIFDIGELGNGSVTLGLDSGCARFHLQKQRVLSSKHQLDDQWHHIALVWDGEKQYVFFDGALDASSDSISTPLSAATLGLAAIDGKVPRIGGQAKAFKRELRFFNGLLDELAIFTRTMNETEVKQIYEAGKAGIHFGQYK